MNNCGTIYGVTPQQIIESIKAITETQEYYKRLFIMAPSEEQSGILSKIMLDNIYSLYLLKRLYIGITCTEPNTPPVYPPSFKNYLEGLVQVKTIEARNMMYFINFWITIPDIFFTPSITNVRTVFGIPVNNSSIHINYIQYILTLNLCK